MLIWDQKFLLALEKSTRKLEWDLHMMRRYVDDSNSVTDIMPPGARFNNGKVVIKNEFVEDDKKIAPDKRTAMVIQEVANSLFPFIQMEIDCPSMNETKKVPILDLQVSVVNNKVEYQHYRKPCASFLTTLAKSAMPYKAKKVSLVQEVVRIHRNTSRRLPEDVRNTSLSEFSFRLKESGYNCKERLSIIQRGTEAYHKQVKRDEEGTCPLYRPKDYQSEERATKKRLAKVAWYRPHQTVLFCPPSPGSALKNRLQKVADHLEKDNHIKIRIVERAGTKLKYLLPGLKDSSECNASKCFLHSNGNTKGDHDAEGVVYKATCATCQDSGPSS